MSSWYCVVQLTVNTVLVLRCAINGEYNAVPGRRRMGGDVADTALSMRQTDMQRSSDACRAAEYMRLEGKQ